MSRTTSPFSKTDIANTALWNALHGCATDHGFDVYDFLEDTLRTTLVVVLTDKLNELGYEIIKVKK